MRKKILFLVFCSLVLVNFLFAEEKTETKPVLSAEEKVKLDKATEKVKFNAKKKGLQAKDVEQASRVLNRLVEKGLPVKHAEEIVTISVGEGLKGEEISQVADAVIERHEKVDYQNLGKDIKSLLKQGLRGEALAKEIHKRIELRHQQKKLEQERKHEEKKEKMREEHKHPEIKEHKPEKGMGGGHRGGKH